MLPFARGRRLFTWSCIATIVVAALHTIGNTVGTPPGDAAFVSLESAMRGYRIPMGMGMSPSVWEIYRGLVFTMSLCLVAMGALGLAVAGSRDATTRLLSRLALVFAISSAALTILYWVYQIPPPLISMAIVTVLFAIAFRTTAQAE
ncbi:MAG TPA: hypothetical protein VHI99_29075 [Vicinamibacterales bacterium]|jgi:hypothetical protein|nr:hypothetical protein [Vicinamibacterales bacterium]